MGGRGEVGVRGGGGGVEQRERKCQCVTIQLFTYAFLKLFLLPLWET